MMAQTVFLRLPSPLLPLQLRVDPSTPLSELIPTSLAGQDVYLRSASKVLSRSSIVADVLQNDASFCSIDVCARARGGKGGFGTNLRAAGGRMSMGKANNTDACRDLSGRRLSTLKEAQRQADLLESADSLRAQAVAEQKAKLEGLERTLGISHDPESSTAGSKRIAEIDVEELARKKHRFEDSKFLEESREINEGVRSAVSAAMLLKRKKKAKAAATTASAPSPAAKAGVEVAKKAEMDKAAMPPPTISASVA